MYIEPNTTIILLKDCPLDTTYEHTIYFGTKSAQEKYFKSLSKYTLNEQTYQRVNRGRMRVAYKSDSIYDCNYLMFQNTNYGSKWFYAFIKSIEYVNNITSEIEYEIDVMQTWFFDYTLGQCFVEREHVDSDKIGEHTVPEKLETGDYISEEISSTGFLGETYIVIATTFDDNYENVSGGLYAGVYSGLYLHTFQNNAQGAAAANSFINGAVNANKLDGIITVTLMSQHMVSERGSTTPKTRTITKTKFTALKRADGSAIKNNKLLTYPYIVKKSSIIDTYSGRICFFINTKSNCFVAASKVFDVPPFAWLGIVSCVATWVTAFKIEPKTVTVPKATPTGVAAKAAPTTPPTTPRPDVAIFAAPPCAIHALKASPEYGNTG